MTVEILKNGSEHECQDVDAVVARLDVLQQWGLRGHLLLIDLHRLSVPDHPGATTVTDLHRADLKSAGLLDDRGEPPLIVKDVVLSATRRDGDTLKYTGAPYMNDRPHHNCPYRAFLRMLFPFMKLPKSGTSMKDPI